MVVTVADDDLQALREKLKDLPSCFKIYCEVMTKQDGVLKGFDFIVDRWPDFKAVVTKPNPEKIEFKFLDNIYNVGGSDVTSVIELLETPGVVDWKKNCVFVCLDENISTAINAAIAQHGGKSDSSEPCDMQCVTKDRLNLKPVPDGFKLVPLTPDDSDLVNSMWKYTIGDDSHTYIETLISTMPSCCLYDGEGRVLGFAMCYHYGALGLLHVMEEHRGNGYGKVIMSHLANERLKLGREAFVIIEKSNPISLKLHEGLGFQTWPDVKISWIRNIPKGCCGGKKTCCI